MLGVALLFVGGIALILMHVTGTIPFRWPWQATQRHEDPAAFRRVQIIYACITAIGAGLVIVVLLR